VKENDPPLAPGTLSVRLDMQGRLIRFSAEPSQLDEGPGHPPQPDKDNWAGLFAAAGIDAAHLTPTEPRWTPPSVFDARAAWSGTFPEQHDLALRVEAAAWRGKPVYFEIIGPWATPERGVAVQSMSLIMQWASDIWMFLMVLFGGMLAWRNLRQGRSLPQGGIQADDFCGARLFCGRPDWLAGNWK
jgi:hypothetical protein